MHFSKKTAYDFLNDLAQVESQVFFIAVMFPYDGWWSKEFGKISIPSCSFQEFDNQYGHKINTATRPYSFIEFDTYIQVGDTFGI